MGLPAKIRRPRYKRHRRHDRKFDEFLGELEERWEDAETRIDLDAVDHANDELDLASDTDPTVGGPFDLEGVPVPELRDLDYFFVRGLADDKQVHSTALDAIRDLSQLAFDAWALSFDFATTDVNTTDNEITEVGHGMETGDGPVQPSSSGTLPAGLTTADHWVIKVDDDTFQLATSLANALAGTEVDVTDQGSGTHTITRIPTIGLALNKEGLIQWMRQGVHPETMLYGDTGDPGSVFE